jgi:3-hydroxybutyryl-CoA dehydrogenase
MGADIAQAVALSGQPIILHDTDERVLRQALGHVSRGIDKGVQLKKIDPVTARRAKRAFTISTSIEACAAANVVIEAVYEDFDLKQSVLQALDRVVGPDTILASNTNTLSITTLAAGTRLPERVIGLHFFNPAHIMRLVEVVRGETTRQEIIDRSLDLIRQMGKTPLLVEDKPGQVVNRIAQAYYGEALHLLDDGSLDLKTIDRLMEAGGFPMGPFRLMDFLGVDTVFEMTQSIFEGTFYTSSYRPNPRQQRLIQAGRLGRKSGHGFYEDLS